MTTDTSGHELALAQAEAMIERQADEIARLRDENARLLAEMERAAIACSHQEAQMARSILIAAMQKGECWHFPHPKG